MTEEEIPYQRRPSKLWTVKNCVIELQRLRYPITAMNVADYFNESRRTGSIKPQEVPDLLDQIPELTRGELMRLPNRSLHVTKCMSWTWIGGDLPEPNKNFMETRKRKGEKLMKKHTRKYGIFEQAVTNLHSRGEILIASTIVKEMDELGGPLMRFTEGEVRGLALRTKCVKLKPEKVKLRAIKGGFYEVNEYEFIPLGQRP